LLFDERASPETMTSRAAWRAKTPTKRRTAVTGVCCRVAFAPSTGGGTLVKFTPIDALKTLLDAALEIVFYYLAIAWRWVITSEKL